MIQEDRYKVLKKFVLGSLSGITVTEVTSEKYEVGEVYSGSAWSKYIVLACRKINNNYFV